MNRSCRWCSFAWVVGVAAAQTQWREESLSTQRNLDMVFDEARGRMVAFRGDRAVEWDGFRWVTRATATRPVSRAGARVVWDSSRRRVLMFGGVAGTDQFDDLWSYDGADWTLLPAATRPVARTGHAMAFDRARGRAIVFGGNLYGGAYLGDTWEWDGSAWTMVANVPALARNEAAMAWHPGSQRTILFGGANNVPLADTWSWDGTTWIQLNPATTPVRRATHRMTTDFTRGCLVMFGGPDAQTWEWWGNDWQQGPAGPAMRTGQGLAWDGSTGQVTLYGGTTAALSSYAVVTLGDTWTYDGSQWLQIGLSGPQPRTGGSADYDSARDRLVFYGGGETFTTPSHTWEWDGAQWRESVPPVEPPLFQLTRLCYDHTRRVSVLFGGMLSLFGQNAVWEWDGTTWRQPTPAVVPPGRWEHAMAFDRARSVMLVFGGRDLLVRHGDTWAWNGTTWSLLANSGPQARGGASMAFDVARARMVLYGGVGYATGAGVLGDTWEWNGTAWLQRNPVHSPGVRAYAGMTHDSVRGRTVLVGGARAGGYQQDSWEWDGTDWTRAGDLADVFMATLAFDDRRGRIVTLHSAMAGGLHVSNDVWVGSADVATARIEGAGCGGAVTPRLLPFGMPVLGRPAFRLDLVRLRANAPFGLAVGTDPTTIALPFGCRLLQNGLVTVVGVANGDGFAVVPAPVPANPALLGLDLAFQAGAIDPTAPLGFGLTAPVVGRVGD